MKSPLPLFFLLALAGCKGSREKDVVGNWTSAAQTVTVEEAKTFKSAIGPMTLDGTWTIEGDDLTLTPKNMNGKPIAELKAQMQKSIAAIPVAQRAQVEGFVKDIDTPNVMTLSADGKSLTTNKAKDKNTGPGTTLTKA